MELTADAFLARLQALQSDEELKKYQRYFKFGEGEYAHWAGCCAPSMVSGAELDAFLDRHGARMPRNALEHYPPDERARYLAMGK